MTQTRAFTDEELTAYLDGEADDTLRAAIDHALETDDKTAAQLASLDIPLGPISAAFDTLLQTAPSPPDVTAAFDDSAMPAARTGRWMLGAGTFATGLAAGLAVAVFTGLGTPKPAPRGWVSFVASYQALYTTDTLANADPTPQDAAAQLAIVSDALGLDLNGLPQAQGLTFKRAQILGFKDKPLIQIAFAREDGTPVALCIIPAGPDEKPVSMGAAEGLDLARWNTPGFGFLLIGGSDSAPLATEAATFQAWSANIAI